MGFKRIVAPPPRRRVIAAPGTELGGRLIADTPAEESTEGQKSHKREPNSGSFQKGLSGNPNGRPKKAKGAKAISRKALLEVVDVKMAGERSRKMTVFEALVKKERAAAFAGDWRARNTMFTLARWALVDRDDEQTNVETPAVTAAGELTDTGQAILDWFAEEVRAGAIGTRSEGGDNAQSH